MFEEIFNQIDWHGVYNAGFMYVYVYVQAL